MFSLLLIQEEQLPVIDEKCALITDDLSGSYESMLKLLTDLK